MSRRLLPALLGLGCILAAPLPSVAQPSAPQYFTDRSEKTDYPNFVELRADGSYAAKIDGNQIAGVYDIRGSRLYLHVQNGGDLTLLMTNGKLKLPSSSGFVVFTLTQKPFIPQEFIGRWVLPKSGSSEVRGWVDVFKGNRCHVHFLLGDQQQDYDADIFMKERRTDRSIRNGTVSLIRSYSVRIDPYGPGMITSGTVCPSEMPIFESRLHYVQALKLTLFTPPVTTTGTPIPYDFYKPYVKGQRPLVTVVQPTLTKPKHQQPVDTFGLNGVGD